MAVEKNIYIHYNFNKQEIKDFLVGNSDYNNRTMANQGSDKGMLYYDEVLDKLMMWDGSTWRITQFLDDRDLLPGQDIFIEDIWTQTNLIPITSSQSVAKTSPVLEYVTGITMSNITNTYVFTNSDGLVKDVTPSHKYGDAYIPLLRNEDGDIIPQGLNNWKLEFDSNKEGFVTFYGGFNDDYLVSETHELFLEFWKYTGTKGSFNIVGNDTSIFEIVPSLPNYNEFSIPYTIVQDDILSVTINGILIYDYSFNVNSKILTIDESGIGYIIDSQDIIRVEIKQ